jgi:hypothetical protein
MKRLGLRVTAELDNPVASDDSCLSVAAFELKRLVGFRCQQEVPVVVVGDLLSLTDLYDSPMCDSPAFGLRECLSYVEEVGIAVVYVPRKLGISVRTWRFGWDRH